MQRRAQRYISFYREVKVILSRAVQPARLIIYLRQKIKMKKIVVDMKRSKCYASNIGNLY